MSPLELITLEEWDAEIKKHSLHLKFDSQLFFVEEMLEAKIPSVNRDLMEILFFPDAKKKEICENYIQAGEITNYFDLETPVPIPVKDKEKIDAEYVHEVEFYTNKLSWLKDKLTCCQKEMELRADKLVKRIPKGTPYFVDFDNGNDANDGTTAIKTNGDGPFATLQAYTAIATAGDICTVRRGMTQAVSADLAFANDGTLIAPITMEADFDDTDWGAGGDETVAGETATLTFGSKTVTFADDISGDIAAGDLIYESTEDNREFAYEVASVTGGSNEIVTLYLPYKGAISGAGKTINIMPYNPRWNTAAGNFQVNLDGDHYWKFQGLHLRGTDTNGVFECDSVRWAEWHDCILEGNGAADYGIKSPTDSIIGVMSKCRFYNYVTGIYASEFIRELTSIRDCLLDGNNTVGSTGIRFARCGNELATDCEFKNHATGDVRISGTAGTGGGIPYFRNCLLSSATELVGFDDADNAIARAYTEDHDQVEGINKRFSALDSAVGGTPAIQSEETEVRAGGGASSIKVTPLTNLSTNLECARILLFEYPIYAVKDVAKTYTAYLRSDDDTDWDADPTNTELWIEAEYWGHATNVHRKILKSTEVCNNFDADDTVWDTLTVTVTPLQTGVLYLRGYYCKTKEGGKSNIFFCDTVIGVA